MNVVKCNPQTIEADALSQLGVSPTEKFDPTRAERARINYLKGFLRTTGLSGFVLGISGGVDSLVAGTLAQRACRELTAEGTPVHFHAVRLPAGIQRDEDDAQASLDFIAPDYVHVINVGPAANALALEAEAALAAAGLPLDAAQADYHKGNVKARARMAAQYHLAGALGCAVLGTDHNAEALMGFYTKFGDGACDLIVLNGLNKRQVRILAYHLGAPERLWNKAPTADLEELNPGKLDDEGFGVPYAAVDDFLEGKDITYEHRNRILEVFWASRHKREPIVSFPG